MSSFASGDARTALLATYFARHPLAGVSHSSMLERTYLPSFVEESRPKACDTRYLGHGADEKVRIEGISLTGSAAQSADKFGSRGRTIYSERSFSVSSGPQVCPTLAKLERIDAEERCSALDRLVALAAGREEMEREEWEFRREETMERPEPIELLLKTPPLGGLGPMPGLSPSGSSESDSNSDTSYELSLTLEPFWPDQAWELSKTDEMFDMFIKADEWIEPSYRD